MSTDEIDGYLQTELDKHQADLASLTRQAESLQGRIAKVQQIIQGLEALMQKRGTPRLKRVNEWTILHRTDAVLRVLIESEQPLSPRQIADRLAERGRSDDTPNAVSGALTRLKTARKVLSIGRGLWVSVPHVTFNQAAAALKVGDNLGAFHQLLEGMAARTNSSRHHVDPTEDVGWQEEDEPLDA